MIRRAKLALCLIAGASLAACSHGVPTTATVALQGGADLNPAAGQPSPVQVRLYQLRATSRFANADYFQLSDKESATLGNELVAREDVFVRPGQTSTVSIAVKPDAKFLGVAAAFRDIDHSTWRGTVPLAGRITVKLAGDTVTVADR